MCRFFFLVSILVGCASASGGAPQYVSVYELLVLPQKFDGQLVRVTGWFDGYRLWPTKSAFEADDKSSSVFVRDRTGSGKLIVSCENMLVEVTAVFRLRPDGRDLDLVESVYAKENRSFCWEKE